MISNLGEVITRCKNPSHLAIRTDDEFVFASEEASLAKKGSYKPQVIVDTNVYIDQRAGKLPAGVSSLLDCSVIQRPVVRHA